MQRYSRHMKPESARMLQSANEAAIALLTLLTIDAHDEAITLVSEDDAYADKVVTIVLATYTAASIQMIAKVLESDPLDLLKTIALDGAKYILEETEDTED